MEEGSKKRPITSFKLFEIGVPIITLVEDFPCDRKEQLLARERWHIENNECVNRNTPNMTRQETNQKYMRTHREHIKKYQEERKDEKREYDKQYRIDNNEMVVIRKKKYYEQNKEKIYASNKIYNDANRDKINARIAQWVENNQEKRKESLKKYGAKEWKCECCDVIVLLRSKGRHMKTEKHIGESQI